MKRKIFSIAVSAFVLALIISSCTSPNKVLVKKDGNWTAITTTKTTAGGVSVTTVDTSTMNFKDDGTGTIASGGLTLNFNWTWDKKDKKIEFTITIAGVPYIKDYTVTEKKAKSEKWSYSKTETTSGVSTVTDEQVSLTKMD